MNGGPDPVAAALAEQPVVLLDGGLATELERRGADLADALWSARLLADAPQAIAEVHFDYFRAGADIATTASYQATFEGYAARGIDAAGATALMRRSVELACTARDRFWADAAHRAGRRFPLVAASVGPYGAMLADGSEYRGHYRLDEEALVDFHRPRMRVLVDAGADLLACETLPCIAEARALARLLREFPGTSAWFAFSCRDGAHTSQGEPFAEAVAALDGCPQAAAIGINCTAPEHIASLVRIARARTTKPVVVYPNSGEQYDAAGHCWHGHGAAWVDAAPAWVAAGARLVGGCCRTGPEDIAALRARLLPALQQAPRR